MSYQPYVGKLEDGTEVLVTIHRDIVSNTPPPVPTGDAMRDHFAQAAWGRDYDVVESVEVAFRTPQYRTWSAPTVCERAP